MNRTVNEQKNTEKAVSKQKNNEKPVNEQKSSEKPINEENNSGNQVSKQKSSEKPVSAEYTNICVDVQQRMRDRLTTASSVTGGIGSDEVPEEDLYTNVDFASCATEQHQNGA
ncbi:hypothetical protein NHX12_018205, partial [Muraenolepis orangiensis]